MKMMCSVAGEGPSQFNNRQDIAHSKRQKELLRRLRLARRDLRYVQPKSQDLDILFQRDITSGNFC
jgi:hypothetical protein